MRNATPLAPKISRKAKPLRSPAKLEQLRRERDEWLAEVDPQSHFHKLFDLLPGVCFFAKDRQGRAMFSSQRILDLYGMSDESPMLGLTDFDLNPDRMAESYVRDDEAIYATGKPLLNRLELWFDRQGMPDWFVVHKLPILSRSGEIIGIMGVLQRYAGEDEQRPPFAEITAVVQRIRQEYPQRLAIRELARRAGISPRQLERRFHETLGITPQEFLIKTRVLAASQKLSSSRLSLAEVASACGFYDQSSFTQMFRKYTGLTPAVFRQKAIADARSSPPQRIHSITKSRTRPGSSMPVGGAVLPVSSRTFAARIV